MRKRLSLVIAVSLIGLSSLFAQELKAVVPQLSPMATDTFKKIIEAIVDSSGKTISLQIVPFARAVYLIENKQADIECSAVQIPDQKKWSALAFDYSSAEIIKIVFVLYTNKAKPISAVDLKSGNAKGYKIETDVAHVGHFAFAATPSTSIDASLQKVDSGAIDGFLFSQGSSDPALKRLGLKNIARQYYDTFSGVCLLQKGGRGGPMDAMITDGMARLKANGKYQTIIGPYAAGASKYIEWQP
jgi:polar amino acid transport system substrate-binding protein